MTKYKVKNDFFNVGMGGKGSLSHPHTLLLKKHPFILLNQHWLIQEAEQRRLAGGSSKPPNGVSPSIAQHNTMNAMNPQHHNNGVHSSMQMMNSPVSHGEIPTSPNNIHANSPVYENSSYVNHQQVIYFFAA